LLRVFEYLRMLWPSLASFASLLRSLLNKNKIDLIFLMKNKQVIKLSFSMYLIIQFEFLPKLQWGHDNMHNTCNLNWWIRIGKSERTSEF